MADYHALVSTYGGNPALSLLFAPEPKLAGVGLGAKGVVLAESFFAPTVREVLRPVGGAGVHRGRRTVVYIWVVTPRTGPAAPPRPTAHPVPPHLLFPVAAHVPRRPRG